MSEVNRRVAIAFVEAMGHNDLEGVVACMASDGVLEAMGMGRFAGAHTPDMIAGSIDALSAMFPSGLNFAIRSVTAQEDRVVVEARSNAEIGEANPFQNDYVFVAEFEAGKIKHCREYYCTVHADTKLWPLAEKAGYGFD